MLELPIDVGAERSDRLHQVPIVSGRNEVIIMVEQPRNSQIIVAPNLLLLNKSFHQRRYPIE